MNTIKQVTELSPLCAALISMLEEMMKHEDRDPVAFHQTSLGAHAHLEEMRAAAKVIPTGLRQDMAYELISHHSSALTRVMLRHQRNLTIAYYIDPQGEPQDLRDFLPNYMDTLNLAISLQPQHIH